MNDQVKLWLEKEMDEMQKEIQSLNQKLMKKVPLWMALCVGVMVVIGLLAGYDFAYILKVHFLIGCGFAFFVWLCFFLQTKTTSIKRVKKDYVRALEKDLADKEVMDAFSNQMGKGRYEVITFQNPTTDKYPARLLVGDEFLVYYRLPSCTIVLLDDIKKISVQNETTNVSYNVGNRRVHQNVSVGVSLTISYKSGKEDSVIMFGNGKQVEQTKELIQKHMKGALELFD